VTDRRDPGGGGMTGATGDLTPDDSDAPFVPAERREQAGEHGQGSVTYHQGAAASAQQGEVGEPGVEHDPGHALNRESGYGSQHGLSPNDPAYHMEVQPPPDAAHGEPPRDETSDERPASPRPGVDEIADHEERF
jgi:hypothetical protein